MSKNSSVPSQTVFLFEHEARHYWYLQIKCWVCGSLLKGAVLIIHITGLHAGWQQERCNAGALMQTPGVVRCQFHKIARLSSRTCCCGFCLRL